MAVTQIFKEKGHTCAHKCFSRGSSKVGTLRIEKEVVTLPRKNNDALIERYGLYTYILKD